MKNNKGYTLVELIVTFALISIFMASASVVFTSLMQIFIKVDGSIKTQTVADMLMETMVSDIEAASDVSYYKVEDAKGNFRMFLEEGGTGISYVDKNEYRVTIREQDGYLVFTYHPVEKSPGAGKTDGDQWFYGKKNYMGTKITSLKFEKVKDNLIRVSLTLSYKKTDSELKTSKVFPCFNLSSEDIVNRDNS